MPPSLVAPPAPDRSRPLRRLVGDVAGPPGWRRAGSVVRLVMLLTGIALLAYPAATDVYSRWQQGEVPALGQDRQTGVSPADRVEAGVDVAADGDARVAFAADDPTIVDAAEPQPAVPAITDGVTTLRIPKVGLEVVVVEGTTPEALRTGVGHYTGTPLPGQPGNVALAGHRTTYGRPLNRLDELGPGDVVEIETPLAVHVYRAVEAFDGHPNPRVVAPTETSVVAPVGGASLLTLTTCHPKGSARQRLVMRFELADSRPVAGASG